MSSTDVPGDGVQQDAPPIAEPTKTASTEAVTEPTAADEAATLWGAPPPAESSHDPAPAEPTAVDPAPVEPTAVNPAPVEPDPVEPGPDEPASVEPPQVESSGSSTAVTPEAGTPAAATPTDAAVADPTTEPASAPQPPAPSAQPPATPRPSPAALAGHPPRTTPVAMAAAAAVAEPVVVPASDPTQWGRVDAEGTVYVRTGDTERAVGSWQAGEPEAGLAHYGRRFDDLATEVALLEARLRALTGNPAEIKGKAQSLADTLPDAAAVGDLAGLAARAGAMVTAAEAANAVFRADRAAARAAQIARKEALAAEAEQLGAESTAWKAAGDRLKSIVEEWKTIRGIDRKTDDALWHRFTAARDAFGRRRGTHFASLDAQKAESRGAKQELIGEAQRLSTSTEWGPTSAAMRSLMDRWKAVPRSGREGDDDLWKQFRAAQDVFFTARTESDKARSTDELANQQLKEELLAEAEKLDPGKDLRGAQNALRKLQERYDAVGHVPRGAMRQLEDRMQTVEQKVRGAADVGRSQTTPENPMVTSMRAAVTKAGEQLAKAEAAGDARRIAEATANLTTRREWLAEAEKSATRR